jgi:O-antigen/teichoic acid export membrane protein
MEETLEIDGQLTHKLSGLNLPGGALQDAAARSKTTTSIVSSPAMRATTSRLWKSGLERILKNLSGGSVFHKGMLSLADQGIVSAVNFLTMVLLRRSVVGTADVANQELGIYNLGFSIVVLATCAQNALIASPYAVFGNRLTGHKQKQYAGSTLLHQILLSALLSGMLLFVGAGITWGWGAENFSHLQWILAVMLPFILAREFVRRIAFAHLQVLTALVLDVAVAVLQLSGLWALKLSGQMNAGTTFCVTGAACAVAAVVAFFILRGHFAVCREKAWPDLQLNWSFGKWIFGAQAVFVVMSYCLSWMLAFLAGPEATGRYAACMSVVLVSNPILIGLNNFLTPQAINVYHAQGIVGLRRFTRQITLLMAGFVGALVLVLVVFGTRLVALLYGTSVLDDQWVVPLLAMGILTFAVSLGAENGLTAMRRPQGILWANICALPVMLGLGAALILWDGVQGAAIAALSGTVIAAILKMRLFSNCCREETNQLQITSIASH